MADRLTIAVPDELVERVAERAAELVLERLERADNGATPSPYLSVVEAAEYLRAKRHRVDDLLSRGTLTRFKDGARTLVSRAELEAYVQGQGNAARTLEGAASRRGARASCVRATPIRARGLLTSSSTPRSSGARRAARDDCSSPAST